MRRSKQTVHPLLCNIYLEGDGADKVDLAVFAFYLEVTHALHSAHRVVREQFPVR